MMTAVRRVQFCAGHRVWQHAGVCRHVHGHNYVVYFHATAERLDDLGMVIDFEVLKTKLGGWILEHWDHGFICCRQDTEAAEALGSIAGQKLYLLDENPTAENMALHLLHAVGPEQLAGTGVRLVRVVLWETENCCAEASV